MQRVTVFALLALIVAFVVLYATNGEEDRGIDACTARGVAYFKRIGSYPTLSSLPNRGRAADDVARERCGRTTAAFS